MLTKPELDRLERIATAILAGFAESGPKVPDTDWRARKAIAQAQELIKQLDALAEAE